MSSRRNSSCNCQKKDSTMENKEMGYTIYETKEYPGIRPSFFNRFCQNFQSFFQRFKRRRSINPKAEVYYQMISQSRERGRRKYDDGCCPLNKNRNNLGFEWQSADEEPANPFNKGQGEDKWSVSNFCCDCGSRSKTSCRQNPSKSPLTEEADAKNLEDVRQLIASVKRRERSSSLATLDEVNQHRLNSGLKKLSACNSLCRISRPHLIRGQSSGSRVLTPYITPTSTPGGYRSRFQRQLKLANSICKGAGGPIPAEYLRENTLREDIEDIHYSRQKHEFEDGDSDYEEVRKFDRGGKTPLEPKEPEPKEPGSLEALFADWGSINFMYIPPNEMMPKREGPSFKRIDKSLHPDQIDDMEDRHMQVGLNRIAILAALEEIAKCADERWQKRRVIGLMKRKLRDVNNLQSLRIVNDLEYRFHHINWLSAGSGKPNYVGRYFDMEDNRLVAVKIYGYGFTRSVRKRLDSKLMGLTEIDALAQIDCANVVQMFAYFELNCRIHLVLEACDHSLRCEIQKAAKGIHPSMAQGVIRQILTGLDFCHNLCCLHGDLCPDNILVTSDGTIKLADFEKATFLTHGNRGTCRLPATIAYSAPEFLIRSSEYDLSADIWSVGCVLGEMLRGTPLWDYVTEAEQLFHIQLAFDATINRKPNFVTYSNHASNNSTNLREMLPRVPEDVIHFINKCLELDPRNRSTCEGLLQHNFLKSKRETVDVVSPVQHSMAEAILPRLEHWSIRPHSAPFGFSFEDVSAFSESTAQSPPGDHQFQVGQQKNHKDSSILEPQDVVAKPLKKVKKRKKSQVCLIPAEKAQSTLPPTEHDSGLWNQLVKHNYSLTDVQERRRKHPLGSASDTSAQVHPSILKNGQNKIQKKKVSKVTFLEDGSRSRCVGQAQSNIVLPVARKPSVQKVVPIPRLTFKDVIACARTASWNSVEAITLQLRQIRRKSPRIFANNFSTLITTLLDQVALSQPKMAGPSIRILRTLYDFTPKLLEPEIERIVPILLGKLGGPLFIDTECTDILQQIVKYTDPTKACLAFVRSGINQKPGTARTAAGRKLCDAMRKLNFLEDIGDSNTSQKRLTSNLFEAATRFTRDSHANLREIGKEIFSLLLSHPSFWQLYLGNVQEDQRHRINPLLDEIRRCNRS